MAFGATVSCTAAASTSAIGAAINWNFRCTRVRQGEQFSYRIDLVEGPLLLALLVHIVPPTQPSPYEQFAQPTPDPLIPDRRDAIWGSGAENCRDLSAR